MDTEVTPMDDGPYRIQGNCSLTDVDGNTIDVGARKAVFLCRCGKSAAAPFCDGAHKSCAFTSRVRGGRRGSSAADY